MDARVIVIVIMQKFGEKSIYIGWFMAILLWAGTQATSRSPVPLGLNVYLNFCLKNLITLSTNWTGWSGLVIDDNVNKVLEIDGQVKFVSGIDK